MVVIFAFSCIGIVGRSFCVCTFHNFIVPTTTKTTTTTATTTKQPSSIEFIIRKYSYTYIENTESDWASERARNGQSERKPNARGKWCPHDVEWRRKMPTPKYKNEERKKERNEKWFGRMPITLKIQFRSIASYSNLLLVVSLPRRLFHFHSVRVLLASVLRAAAAAAISLFSLRHCCRRRCRCRGNFDDREWYVTFL